MKTYIDYGTAFRAIRQRRRLTSRELADELTPSAISHFERDGSDMGISKLIKLLGPTYSSITELSTMVEATADPLTEIMSAAGDAYMKNDAERLRAIGEKFKREQHHRRNEELLQLCLRELYRDLIDQPLALSESEQIEVQEYLLAPGPWLRFEYVVYGSLCLSLPTKVNLRLCRAMLKAYQSFNISEYEPLLVQALHNVLLSLLHHRATSAQLLAFQPWLKQSTYVSSVYLTYKLKLLTRVVTYYLSPTSTNRGEIDQLISALAVIDAKLAATDREWIATLIATK